MLPAVWNNSVAVGNVIVHLPQRLVGVAQAAFGSGPRDPNGPISVVGVGRVAGEIASSTAVPLASKAASLIGILGSLNIALFVFNLIPLLPLDGGHIIGALWEGLRRSIAKLLRRRDPGPVDTAKLMPLTFAVAILLGGMSLLLIYADIVRPVDALLTARAASGLGARTPGGAGRRASTGGARSAARAPGRGCRPAARRRAAVRRRHGDDEHHAGDQHEAAERLQRPGIWPSTSAAATVANSTSVSARNDAGRGPMCAAAATSME